MRLLIDTSGVQSAAPTPAAFGLVSSHIVLVNGVAALGGRSGREAGLLWWS